MKARNTIIAATAALILSGCSQEITLSPGKAIFKSFTYSGNDSIYSSKLGQGEIFNPILQGAYSDASICRRGNDYYMATANYVFFPGVPVLHSTDLVNWEQICYALPTDQQLLISSLKASNQGLYPPTIRFNERDSMFYITSTLVGGGGHFVIKAKDPAGPWSDPAWLQGIGGVHSSLFFDDDGKAYITNQGRPNYESPYSEYMVIWLEEIDLKSMKQKGERRIILKGGDVPSKNPSWLETPHIFKKGEYYILTASEGGALGNGHASCAYRSKNIWGPYERYPQNPILTQRRLKPGSEAPVSCTGHIDMVEAPDGQWWAVFQGTRTYSGNLYIQGRETFIYPVSWDNGWPYLIRNGDKIATTIAAPNGAEYIKEAKAFGKYIPHGNFTYVENFYSDTLPLQWQMLRTPPDTPFEPNGAQGLELYLGANNLRSQRHTGFIALRAMHSNFGAETEMHFMPESKSDFAGLAMFLDDQHNCQIGVTISGDDIPALVVEQAQAEGDAAIKQEIASVPLGSRFRGRIFLKAERQGDNFRFMYKLGPSDEYIMLENQIPAKYLSLGQDGSGFFGLTVGPYASSEEK